MFSPDHSNNLPTFYVDPFSADAEAPLLETLREMRADVHVCPHWNHGQMGSYSDATHLMVMSSGGGIGDILDTSNGHALYAIAQAWEDAEPRVSIHHGAYDWTYVCVDIRPDSTGEFDADTLASIVSVAEGYADYPVLDESDYSEREMLAFAEEFTFSSSRLSPVFNPDHPLWNAAVESSMEWYGYSDPGYISEEHVAQSWAAAALSEEVARCVYCAEFIDYCQGHGEIGDPDGYAAIQAIYGEDGA